MKKITFNRGDWSGRTETIKITKKNEFSLYGYRFRLEFSDIRDPEGRKICDEVKVIDLERPERPFARGTKYEGKKTWYIYHTEEFSRDHEDPFVAAAQLVCNLY